MLNAGSGADSAGHPVGVQGLGIISDKLVRRQPDGARACQWFLEPPQTAATTGSCDLVLPVVAVDCAPRERR